MAQSTSRGGPSIHDVAQHAGVSAATVSRVLNNSARVAPAKAELVRQAVEQLGFRPSSLARALSLGRTGTIGVIAPFFTHLGTFARLRGITDRAAEEGYELMIFDVQTPRHREDALLKLARRDRVDAVLVISVPLTEDDAARLRSEDLPVVLIDVARPGFSRVTIDDVAGGRLATEHLLAAGRTRIAFIGDETDGPLGFTASDFRLDGYRDALASAGIAFDDQLIRRGPHGRDAARALTGELLALEQPPTAIFAASDLQAIGVLEAAAAAGLDVPGQLAVVGFDDVDFAEILGLTTVRQPLAEIGKVALELLLTELGDRAREPVEIVHPVTLIERRTT